MIVYPWHEATKEALPQIKKTADHPNPIGRSETDTPTPESIPSGRIIRAVLTEEGWFKSWEIVVDQRGSEYWTQDGIKHIILDLNLNIPTDCLTTPPPSPFHRTHDGSAWIVDLPILTATRRQERDGKLSSAYSPALEQLTRWIDKAESNPAALAHYKTQRSAWHAWADALCDLPDQHGFPWPDGEVPWPTQPPTPTRYNPDLP